jgi:hypothetical protein
MIRTCLIAVLVLSCSHAALAQGTPSDIYPRTEVFGGISVNIDYVPNRPALVVEDRLVSQFVSHGSGPQGFEAGLTRVFNHHVGLKFDVSAYSDKFTGGAAYCQTRSCGTVLDFTIRTRALYVASGPEVRVRDAKRTTLFAHALAGIVHETSAFSMAGSSVTYFDPTGGYSGPSLIVISQSGFPQESTVAYAISTSDTGLTLTLGAGFDLRVGKPLRIRTQIDYDPTFLVRPDLHDKSNIQPGDVARRRQDHMRVTLGLVWRR